MVKGKDRAMVCSQYTTCRCARASRFCTRSGSLTSEKRRREELESNLGKSSTGNECIEDRALQQVARCIDVLLMHRFNRLSTLFDQLAWGRGERSAEIFQVYFFHMK